MKVVRFAATGRVHSGEARDGVLLDEAGRAYNGGDVVWLPPVEPRQVIGLALNYADHASELALEAPPEPALFFKPVSSLIGHRAPVVYPNGAQYMHYENELAVVIGHRCRRVPAARAYEVVRGYTIVNDCTVRDYVHNFYRPPVKAKGFDTFGPCGPWLVEDEIERPEGLELTTWVNGEVRQQGNTDNLMRSVPELIAYITHFMTLDRDDMILTGTPKGISPIHPGDTVRLEISHIGVLENPIVAEGEERGARP
jgi:5-oxopent-3-ene-1,2,5-tricarboxylate decarboxylase/2-hydroxyhepta-2,4-diene-1,7-dioate isomerase